MIPKMIVFAVGLHRTGFNSLYMLGIFPEFRVKEILFALSSLFLEL